MSLKEKVKFLWKKKNVTGFKGFKDYLFIFLNLSGFNVLEDEFFTGYFRKFLIIFTAILPITGFFTSFRVIWLYFDQVEEVIVSTVSWIMTFQAANKLIELAVHRKNHRRMIEIVLKNTESMQDNREFFKIGVKNYNRARFYITITTFAYLSALVSLWSYPFFPLLTRGEFKLAANVEWPGTNHLEGKGWAFNYVYSLVLTGSVAFLVLGKIWNIFWNSIKFFNFISKISYQHMTLFSTCTCFTSPEGSIYWEISFSWLVTSPAHTTQKRSSEICLWIAWKFIQTFWRKEIFLFKFFTCFHSCFPLLSFARKCSELFSTVYLFVSLSDFVIICIALFHLQLVG